MKTSSEQNTKKNLCDTCEKYHDYPYCTDKMKFGDGVGGDNVYECEEYAKMDELKQKVHELEKETDKDKQISILQEIGNILVKKYIIKIENIIIKPLWIEAYYYNIDKGFQDSTVHRDELQQNNFKKLYFHHKKGDRRSGVDICLSDGDYCLSFLLKYTLVNGNFTTQSQLHNLIFNNYNCNKEILFKENTPSDKEDIILNTKRIGIQSGDYKDNELACVREINSKFKTINGKTRSLPNKTKLLKKYIKDTYTDEQLSTEDQRREISNKLVSEFWRSLFE